jgi:uncharacterized protein (TIGR02145 family)
MRNTISILVCLMFFLGCSTTPPPTSQNISSVTICNQIWMNKNLDVTTYRNGDLIPEVTDSTQWANLTTGAWCYYNNDAANGPIYGKLYNFYAVNDPRGLAPSGWHIASEDDWNKLVKCLDNSADTNCAFCSQSTNAGLFLKESGTSHWSAPNNSNNSSGFTALPSGFRAAENQPILLCNFENLTTTGSWWTSGFFQQTYTMARYLHSNNNELTKDTGGNMENGHSVRCVKD